MEGSSAPAPSAPAVKQTTGVVTEIPKGSVKRIMKINEDVSNIAAVSIPLKSVLLSYVCLNCG